MKVEFACYAKLILFNSKLQILVPQMVLYLLHETHFSQSAARKGFPRAAKKYEPK